MGLTDLLAYAAARAPALVQARGDAAVGAAEVDAAAALVPYNPQLQVTLGGRTIAGTSRLEYGARLSQRFQIAGQRGAQLEAAERTRDAAEASVEVVGWRVHAQVHALYCQLLLRKQQRFAAEQLESFVTEVKAIIDRRIEAGEESPLSEMVLRAEVAQARQGAIAARLAEREASFQLMEVIGWSGSELHVAGPLPKPRRVADPAALTARALREHPARRQLEEAVAATNARVDAEDRQAWPDPTLAAGYARESEPGDPAHVWQGQLTVPIPIWARNQAGRARARGAKRQAEASREAFARALGPRLGRLAARVNAAADRVQVYGEDILPAFEQNLDKLQVAYEVGEIDVLKLAQIRERLLSIQRDALVALADYYQAVARLEQEAGFEIWEGDAAASPGVAP